MCNNTNIYVYYIISVQHYTALQLLAQFFISLFDQNFYSLLVDTPLFCLNRLQGVKTAEEKFTYGIRKFQQFKDLDYYNHIFTNFLQKQFLNTPQYSLQVSYIIITWVHLRVFFTIGKQTNPSANFSLFKRVPACV